MNRIKIMAMETIEMQSDNFFKDITKIINSVRQISLSRDDDKFYNGDEIKQLISCIKNRTGIKVQIQNSEIISAAVMIPFINHNHVLFSDQYDPGKQDIKDLLKKQKNIFNKGSVDIIKAKVDGIYSTMTQPMILSRQLLFNNKKLLDEEIAAVLLHEIGHIFTTFEYVNRTSSTNQCLSILSKCLEKNLSIQERRDIFSNIDDLKNLDNNTKENIIKSNTKQQLCTILIKQEVEKSKSELGISLYDLNSAEYLADMFANRFGAGRDLVNALDVLEGLPDNNSMSYILVSLGILFYLPGFIYPLLALFIFAVCLSDNENYYDDSFNRVNRIRNDIIELLKNTKLSSLEKKYLINQLEQINIVLESKDNYKEIWQKIAYWFRPGYKKEKDFEDLQKQLESLSNNDLFAKTARLTLIK